MEKSIHDVEYELMLLGRYQLSVARARKESDQLERSAYVLLSRLEMQGPMTIRELSGAFGLDQSTINRQTAAMLREGLIERIAAPDEIARRLRVTPEGTRRLAADREYLLGRLEEIFKGWPREEIAVFASCLEHFNGSIERISGEPWPRP
ncbi:MarR family winged helix-turn-helix transcriptional regulator [Actinocorallia longicatena]|uniref:MarR family winged helix-turn-helix transcriptional regulator n=1 Tax=Actinocorallia longicatena TaxID=111803 RepID=UPI0031CFB8FA